MVNELMRWMFFEMDLSIAEGACAARESEFSVRKVWENLDLACLPLSGEIG
jgi:hypothetical protein